MEKADIGGKDPEGFPWKGCILAGRLPVDLYLAAEEIEIEPGQEGPAVPRHKILPGMEAVIVVVGDRVVVEEFCQVILVDPACLTAVPVRLEIALYSREVMGQGRDGHVVFRFIGPLGRLRSIPGTGVIGVIIRPVGRQ